MTWLPPSRCSRAIWILIQTRRGLSGHTFKVLQGARHRRGRGSAFSVRVAKYWNKLPSSVVTAASADFFQETVGESLDRSLFPSPPVTEHSVPSPFPISLPPFPPAHHQLTVIISICYPTPCFIYVVYSGPLVAYFFTTINHNQIISVQRPSWHSNEALLNEEV